TDNVAWTSNDPNAVLPAQGPLTAFPFCDFATVDPQTTLTITDVTHPAVVGDTRTFPVRGPEAKPDTVTVVDPSHNGIALYTMDVTANDIQTNTAQGFYLPTCAPPPGGCI